MFFPNKKQHKKRFPLVLIDNEPKKAPFEIPSTMVGSLVLWRKLARFDVQIMEFYSHL
jgi:hypothetical protein